MMKPSQRRTLALGAVGSIVGAGVGLLTAPAQATAPTAQVDDMRTSWDQSEPGLSPGDVASSDFGQLFATKLDGQIYAQPMVANGTLIAVTENDNIYGLDPATGTVKWSRNVGKAWPSSNIGCGDLAPTVGITGTPAYDSASDAVYFTSKVDDGPDGMHPSWYMHAVDPGTGQDKPGWPMKIQGSPSNDPSDTFDAAHEMQRPGLLVLNGTVYAAFGGHCDKEPFRGYVVGVDTQTAQINAFWSSEQSSAGSGAGIWQSGGGLVADGDNHIILGTGNGISPPAGAGNTPPGTLAESVVRLQINADKSLSASDFFSPSDATTLDLNDTDLGSGGPMALPDSFGNSAVPHLMLEQGKDGRLFLLDRDNLGGRSQGPNGTDAAVQVLGPLARQWGHPAAYGGEGGYVYDIGFNGPLRALKMGQNSAGQPQLVPVGTSKESFAYAGTSPVVTSDGATAGSAVVWAIDPTQAAYGGPASLVAYNAIPDSTGTLQRLGAWPIGKPTKFAWPATDDGRVFVGNNDGYIYGFGHPTSSPVTGKALNVGTTKVGSSVKGTMTLTANQAVTVNSVTSPNSVFSVDASRLPKTLAAGQTVSLPVTFTPTTWGSTSAVLSVGTSAGNVGVVVSGTGLQDGLGSQPPSLNFNALQAVGSTQTLAVRIVNTGTVPEQIGTVTMPNGPFTADGIPKTGDTIPVGGSVDFGLTFAPTAPVNITDASLSIQSTSGTLTVPVTAGAVAGSSHMVLTPQALDFGSVPVGQSASKTFTITDSGNLPFVISKAKAPNSTFTGTAISEGTTVGPDNQMTVTVTFTPTATGAFADSYEITADDGQGAQYVQLTGTGGGNTPPPPPGNGNPGVSRLAGADRFATGVSVSQSLWANAGGDNTGRKQAKAVVLARGDAFPDALAGVPLAAKVQGPLLLTTPTALPQQTLDELKRVLPGGGTIYVLGGTSAVSDGVARQLAKLGYTVTRFGGTDRYDTALKIAKQGLGDPGHVILATGLDYADALAAGPFAAGTGASNDGTQPAAILLTNGKQMDPATAAYVAGKARGSSVAAPSVYAVGGPAVKAAATLPGYVRGFSGADRYATDVQLVQAQIGVGVVGVAVGTNFADALTGGAATAVQKGALITVPSTLPPDTATMLTRLAPALHAVQVFGGTKVIPDTTVAAIIKSVGGHAV